MDQDTRRLIREMPPERRASTPFVVLAAGLGALLTITATAAFGPVGLVAIIPACGMVGLVLLAIHLERKGW